MATRKPIREVAIREAAAVGSVLASALLALVLLALTSAPANATFPAPNNGKIVFSKHFKRDAGGFSSDIFSINPDGTGLKRLTSDEGQDIYDSSPVYSPDGKKIAWLSSAGDGGGLWVMNADGSAKRPLETTQVVDENSLAFSPDGEEVAFTCSPRSYGHQKDICTARIDGSGFRNLTQTRDRVEHHFTWSPSGKWLAFVSEKCRDLDCPGEGGFYRVSSATFKIKADGTSLTRLTPDRLETDMPYPDRELTWSPDGEWLAFVRWIEPPPDNRHFDSAIFTMRPDGSSLTRLTRVNGGEFGPAWSHSGTRLLYGIGVLRNGVWEFGLRKMWADGSHKVLLSNESAHAAVWSPDDQRIAFVRYTYTPEAGELYSLYTMRSDGSGKKRLVTETTSYYLEWFDWQPKP